MSDPYYYPVSDVGDSATILANFSNIRHERISDLIEPDPSWRTNSQLIWDTKDCLIVGLRYSGGVVKYIIY